MTASQHKFHRDLGQATVWTYGQPGKTPVLLGPTIVAKTGRPVVVKWINDLPTDPDRFPLKDSIDQTIAERRDLKCPPAQRSRTSTAGTPQRGSMELPNNGGRPTV